MVRHLSLLDMMNFVGPKITTQLRKWLEKEFDVFISQITSEIVNQMSEIGEESTDPFCHWVGSINPL